MSSIRRLLLLSLTTSLAAACTIYPDGGPRRPDSDMATLTSSNTMVKTIDGNPVSVFSGGNYATYKLTPGQHVIGVILNETGAGTRRVSGYPVPVTFTFEAGKTYLTRPQWLDKRWRPVIEERKD